MRGGKFFHNVFSRSSNDINEPLPQGNRRHFKSMDELDGTLRKGVEKSYSPDARNMIAGNNRKSYPPPPASLQPPKSPVSRERNDAGLESLLVSATTSSSFSSSASQIVALRQRSASTGVLHGLMYHTIEEGENLDQGDRQVDQGKEEPKQPISQLGLLLASQLDDDEKASVLSQPQVQPIESKPVAQSHLSEAIQNANIMPSAKNPDPELKKQFTTFHNAAEFSSDSTSPFLGDDPSTSLRHDSYVSYHSMMMRGAGSSVPHHGTSLLADMLFCVQSMEKTYV